MKELHNYGYIIYQPSSTPFDKSIVHLNFSLIDGNTFIPNENDFKRRIKEAVIECLQESLRSALKTFENEDILLSRMEISKFIRISLVTLPDWIKHGLPCYKPKGRVYFMKREVLDYIKENKIDKLKFGDRLQSLRREVM